MKVTRSAATTGHRCLAFNWCAATGIQSRVRAVCLICTGCRGINTFLSFPPMFARAWVCSAVSLSLLCHRVMLNSRSTFPPCLSAATCPSSSVTLLLFFVFHVSRCQWINSPPPDAHTNTYTHTHTHSGTRTHSWFALLSWSCLSPVWMYKYLSRLVPNVTC